MSANENCDSVVSESGYCNPDGSEIACLGADVTIFRYMPVERYFELIEDGVNALAHVSLWEDPYEAFILRAGATYVSGSDEKDVYDLFKNIYGQSWTKREKESDVIWRAMGKRGNTVRIQSTVGKLAQSLIQGAGGRNVNHVRIAPVEYEPDAKVNKKLFEENLREVIEGDTLEKMNFFFLKREAFALEDEVRVIAIPDKHELDTTRCTKGHLLKFDVTASDLIDKVLADPAMDRRLYEQVVCRTLHVSSAIEVRKSTLFDWPKLRIKNPVQGTAAKAKAIPGQAQLEKYLVNKYGEMTRNASCIVARIRRVFKAAGVGSEVPSVEQLNELQKDIQKLIHNPGSAADCRTALGHYRKALFGTDE